MFLKASAVFPIILDGGLFRSGGLLSVSDECLALARLLLNVVGLSLAMILEVLLLELLFTNGALLLVLEFHAGLGRESI
jgi:hypothetical protein